jgi:small-conductance mechanosensitive channel
MLRDLLQWGPARIYPWRKIRRSRAPSIAPGTFFVAQSWADCITNMAGSNLRQAQPNPARIDAEANRLVENANIERARPERLDFFRFFFRVTFLTVFLVFFMTEFFDLDFLAFLAGITFLAAFFTFRTALLATFLVATTASANLHN